MNGMLYVRGNKKNYDDWAAQGAKGWSYKEVLPYFKKMESNKNPEYFRDGTKLMFSDISISFSLRVIFTTKYAHFFRRISWFKRPSNS